MKHVHAFAAAVGLAACTNPTSVNETPTSPSVTASATAAASASATTTASVTAAPPATASASATAASSPCPPTMLLVTGALCEDVVQNCVEFMDPPEAGTARRCARFAPTTCRGEKLARRFCIDRDEHVEPGERLPAVRQSFAMAERKCAAEGKRLCLESEWTLACEGPSALPYPTGLTRPSAACNHDQTKLTDASGRVLDLRRAPEELDKCTSAYGVRSLTGNVDEWTVRDLSAGPHRSALKGGWWMPARNRCRPATVAHDEQYADFQTGFRCCADPAP